MLVDTEPLVGELNVPTIVVETGDYRKLVFKPSINGVELDGDKSSEELGIIIPDVSKYVEDENYVHTDNNYTNEEKEKLSTLENYDDSELKQDINNIDIEIDGLTENMNLINEDLSTQKERITTVNGKVNNLENNLSQQTTKINQLESTKADKDDIPDVSEFVKKTVNDLTNYYLKSDTYTQSEVNQLIGAIKTVSMKVVAERPSTGESNIIYLVPSESSKTENVYNEYIYVDGKWELIGSTQADLSNYYTKEEIGTLLFDYITSNDLEETLKDYAIKNEIPKNTSDLNNDSGFIDNTYHDSTKQDTISDLDNIRSGASKGETALQDIPEEYIKNTDYATNTTAGVIKINNTYALNIAEDGTLSVSPLDSSTYNSRSTYTAISKGTLENIKNSYVKEALVNNSIELNDEEKLKIETWLGLSENYLTYYNTTPYQVDSDYIPAHKKYVDNIVGDIESLLEQIDSGSGV